MVRAAPPPPAKHPLPARTRRSALAPAVRTRSALAPAARSHPHRARIPRRRRPPRPPACPPSAVAPGGRRRAALQIFDWARARGLAPDSHCYGVALAACRSGGAADEATAMLSSLLQGEAQGAKPDAQARPAPAPALPAAPLLERPLLTTPHRPEQMFVSAMWACLKAGEWEQARAPLRPAPPPPRPRPAHHHTLALAP